MTLDGIRICDLPKSVLETIKNEIGQYSTGLVALNETSNVETAMLIGSGTFVQCGDIYGILTAHHVAFSSAFRRCDKLILQLMTKAIHRFHIPRNNLRVIPVGTCANKQDRPDLSVIILPISTVPGIRAKKVFWNLKTHQNANLSRASEIKEGMWILWGCPDVLTQPEQKLEHRERVLCMKGLSVFGSIDAAWIDNEYDYLEFPVRYSESIDVPESFGGCSGGGLWQVRLAIKEDEIIHDRPILSGVAFYQSGLVDNQRTILCHGRVSIYRHVIDALEGIQQ